MAETSTLPKSPALPEPTPDITGLLRAWTAGNTRARDQLFDHVYPTLRRLARQKLLHERSKISIQATDLVHEAYLKLVDQERCEWQCRNQFYAIVTTILRRILVDHAKHHQRLKRGPDVIHLTLDEALLPGAEPNIDVLALDQALVELAGIQMVAARVVELRAFGGLSLEETALSLGLSRRTTWARSTSIWVLKRTASAFWSRPWQHGVRFWETSTQKSSTVSTTLATRSSMPDAADAESPLREALTLARQLPAGQGLAASLSSTGRLAMHRGDHVTAEKVLREALQLRSELEGGENHSHAEALMDLGWALWLQKKPDEAETLLRQARVMFHRIVGEDHPDMAKVLYCLAWVHVGKGEHTSAESLLRQSLDIRRRLQGEEHPETLGSLASIGDFLLAKGDYEEAELVLREVLELDRKVKGERHPDVAIDLQALAQVMWELGHLSTAETLMREALELANSVWGPDYRGTLGYQHLLAEIWHEMGRSRAAEQSLRELLEHRSRLFGPDHRYTGRTLTVGR